MQGTEIHPDAKKTEDLRALACVGGLIAFYFWAALLVRRVGPLPEDLQGGEPWISLWWAFMGCLCTLATMCMLIPRCRGLKVAVKWTAWALMLASGVPLAGMTVWALLWLIPGMADLLAGPIHLIVILLAPRVEAWEGYDPIYVAVFAALWAGVRHRLHRDALHGGSDNGHPRTDQTTGERDDG